MFTTALLALFIYNLYFFVYFVFSIFLYRAAILAK